MFYALYIKDNKDNNTASDIMSNADTQGQILDALLKCKAAGLQYQSTSSDTALSTAQFSPDHWDYSFLITYQLPAVHTAWLLIGAQNCPNDNVISALTVPFFISLI